MLRKVAYLVTALALAKEADPGRPAHTYLLQGCVPAYEVMEPDTTGAAVWWFDVEVRGPAGGEALRFTFATHDCCAATLRAVTEVLSRVPLADHTSVAVRAVC